MPALENRKHELFAQALAKGKPTEVAYAEAGYVPHPQNAGRLMKNDGVAARVAELQERMAIRVEVTAEDILRDLEEDRQLAHAQGQAGAAVSATMGKAKLFGLITDKQKVDANVNVTLESLIAESLHR
jgi:phage terminase small subunit